jgi:phosphoenolpyruvate-protein kinase (PTS system EI component)
MAMRMAAGSATTVLQLTSLQAAVRSGGAAIGALFLWCARVLSESQALKEAETLEQAQQAEENGLADALARAKKHLDAFEEQLRRQREGPCDGHVCE